MAFPQKRCKSNGFLCKNEGASPLFAFPLNALRPSKMSTFAPFERPFTEKLAVIMQFHTPVELSSPPVVLTPQSKVLAIGSCFADHIGAHLQQSLPAEQVLVNPNGVLYNPASIFTVLRSLTLPSLEAEQPYFLAQDGLWHHWLYATAFVHADRSVLEQELQQRRERAKALWNACEVVLVTFSTDHAYYLTEGAFAGYVVSNCHKQPARLFREEVLSPSELYEQWSGLLHDAQAASPQRQFVFTLSPYRYAKYGMHENALSKARLLLLIDELCRTHLNVHYFPAYEIITDELRDYRFYAPDMLHPSEQAIDYVWERFQQWTFSPELCEYARERQQLLRDLAHRPLHPDSEAARNFQRKVEERRRAFEHKWGRNQGV